MYTIKATGQQEKSFTAAIKIASAIGSDVMQGEMVRWTPLPEVSAKKMRVYKERLNAYNAYLKSK